MRASSSTMVRSCRSVTWLMKRWNKSRDTVLRMLEHGTIVGYRCTPAGNWRIDEQKVLEYESAIGQFPQGELTMPLVARLLGVSNNSVKRMIEDRSLQAYQKCKRGRWRILAWSVDEYARQIAAKIALSSAIPGARSAM